MKNDIITVGWREYVGLPSLNIESIKAKIDTGARTSALHAFELHPFTQGGVSKIRFSIHPVQRDTETITTCVADIIDQRQIRDSGGHLENRWVIQSEVTIGSFHWPIELTLTDRDNMRFRMLLGRTAMQDRIIVNPSGSYLIGKRRRRQSASGSIKKD